MAKTAEDVAHETWGEGTGFHQGSGPAIIEMMVAAIEADRAQRAAPHEWEYNIGYLGVDGRVLVLGGRDWYRQRFVVVHDLEKYEDSPDIILIRRTAPGQAEVAPTDGESDG